MNVSGSNKIIQTDVRLIAATNRDLKKMVADREFRSDLYYRLNVFPIHLPPLRERPEDIPLLAKAFTFKIARRLGRNIDSIPAETLRTLSNMEWPGNVRELENVIERAVLLTRGNVLQLSLPDIVLPEPETPPAATVVALEGEDEYQLIVRVLKETNGVWPGLRRCATSGAETHDPAVTDEAAGNCKSADLTANCGQICLSGILFMRFFRTIFSAVLDRTLVIDEMTHG